MSATGILPARAAAESPRLASSPAALASVVLASVLSALIVGLHLANADVPFRDDYTRYAVNQAVACLLYVGLGALILRRHTRHPIGLLIITIGLGTGMSGLCREYVLLGADGGPLLPGAGWAWWVGDWAWYPAYLAPAVLLPILFPTGRPHSPLWWPVAGLAGGLVTAETFWYAFSAFEPDLPPALATLAHPFGSHTTSQQFEDAFPPLPLVYLGVLLAALAAVGARLRRSTGVERLQVGWFAIGTVLWTAAIVIDSFTDYSERWVWGELIPLTLPVLGAAIGIARYDLLDLRRVVHRGAVAAVFAALAAAVYGTAVLFGEHFVGRPRDDAWSAAMAVALIAVAALPLLRWLDGAAGRLVYGERGRPLSVLARLSTELDAVTDPARALQRAAGAVAESLRLPFVRIEADGLAPAVVGAVAGEPEQWPLLDGGLRVGTLEVGRRSVREPFTAAERALIDAVANRLGSRVHAAALATGLRASREQLVLAREEERRRVRHDLHDGLGPRLAGIGLQLDLGREFLERDPDRAGTMFTRAKDELDAALVSIRELVDGLRPPALDELGLVGALEQQVRSLEAGTADGLRFRVEAPADLGPLPAAVEVAAYRIATEAALNAARHSGARRCRVHLALGEDLELAIIDDGAGMADAARPGVGLGSMRARAEELGGTLTVAADRGTGTRISVRIPLR